MQALHAQVEGSAKFAPTTAGRHVITEMDGIVALNAATYKTSHSVRFVVLDDAVLVAKRRRNRDAGGGGRNATDKTGGRLVAERCWPLSEMLVLDTKDSASASSITRHDFVVTSQSRHDERVQDPTWEGNTRLSYRATWR